MGASLSNMGTNKHCPSLLCYRCFYQELRELTKLNRISCIVRRDELEMGRTPASLVELKEQRGKKRIDDLLTKVPAMIAFGAEGVPFRPIACYFLRCLEWIRGSLGPSNLIAGTSRWPLEYLTW